MPMEVLVVCALLVILVVLALRFGYDSRPAIQSKETELACFGMTWDTASIRLAELRREAADERRLREAFLVDGRESRPTSGGHHLNGDRRRTAMPRLTRPVTGWNDDRIPEPTGE